LITQTASLLADARKLSNCPPCYEDCKWISDPAAYKWTLSNDGTNGEHTYGLWFRISGLAVAWKTGSFSYKTGKDPFSPKPHIVRAG